MNFDMLKMNKKELEACLYNEIKFIDINELIHILVQQLPRKYIMRIISKMYRIRKQNEV